MVSYQSNVEPATLGDLGGVQTRMFSLLGSSLSLGTETQEVSSSMMSITCGADSPEAAVARGGIVDAAAEVVAVGLLVAGDVAIEHLRASRVGVDPVAAIVAVGKGGHKIGHAEGLAEVALAAVQIGVLPVGVAVVGGIVEHLVGVEVDLAAVIGEDLVGDVDKVHIEAVPAITPIAEDIEGHKEDIGGAVAEVAVIPGVGASRVEGWTATWFVRWK